jgi:hypothetical protein
VHASPHECPVNNRADGRLRSLEYVEPDDVVSELAKAAPQALAKMSGASRQENPHGAEDKGTAA